jgi:quercetin dioxygenase-like cupin family protein
MKSIISAIAALVLAQGAMSLLLPHTAEAQQFKSIWLAEKKLKELPAGPLYWQIENYPTLIEAQATEGPTSLVAEVGGKIWLFTLGAKGGSSGGTKVVEIGPVPPVVAPEYLLKVHNSGGPPWVKTHVHTHPGSEAFYVLTGKLRQKTPHGINELAEGQVMAGHGPDTPMEVTSIGESDLSAIVLYVLDATRRFSSPSGFRE